ALSCGKASWRILHFAFCILHYRAARLVGGFCILHFALSCGKASWRQLADFAFCILHFASLIAFIRGSSWHVSLG
ncbi:MAG: hypothetical protein WCF99_06915, partial [Chloroflexales bacterium]